MKTWMAAELQKVNTRFDEMASVKKDIATMKIDNAVRDEQIEDLKKNYQEQEESIEDIQKYVKDNQIKDKKVSRDHSALAATVEDITLKIDTLEDDINDIKENKIMIKKLNNTVT